MIQTQWYKNAVIYQIYPRSFMDSNGDGIGDLKGITSKLDYLKELGVNAVWLSPCYKSPNADNGYDISDYRDIMEDFGTLADWEEMVKGMHERGIKLIMDLVVNHTSDEHKWFNESRKSKDNPYRDYYIWRKGRGKNGKKPPNNWTSRFGGSAWEYDENTKEWYMHLCSVKQPVLNWDNPKVREEVQALVKYWLDKGVDGFRCDVITYISKTVLPDGTIPDGKWNPVARGDEKFLHGPHIHEYLQELNTNVLSKYDCMTVGEAAGVTLEQGLLYTGEDRGELTTVFNFEHVECDMIMQVIPKKLDLRKLKKVFTHWQNGLHDKGWNSLYYENHDQVRSLGRFTGDFKDKRVEAAKMLAVSYQLMQGTPYVYEGEEIGMTNYKWKSISEMRDNLALNIWNMLNKPVLSAIMKPIFLAIMNKRSRDQGRMVMQWNDKKNAGFSESDQTWIMANPNYKEINVEAALKDQNSIFYFYKALIAYRKDNAVIRNGTYKDLLPNDKNLFVYEREYEGKKILAICNFKNKKLSFTPPYDLKNAKLILSNYTGDLRMANFLNAYETRVYEL